MISRLVGNILKKNTKTKFWWMKLGLCLVFSNLFFFMLFGGSSPDANASLRDPYKGLVEVQMTATLLTPFQEGKRVLLIHRKGRSRIEAVLKTNLETGVTVLVTEQDAMTVIAQENWEILPYLKDFRFRKGAQGESYEIRY